MRTLALLCCLLLTTPLFAGTDWELVREGESRGDVTTWVKPIPGNPLKAFRGMIEVPHSMLTAFAVLGDVPRYDEWVFQCDGARLLPDLGNDIAYVHVAGIWPVSDRDIVTRTDFSQDADSLAIDMHSIAVPSLYPPEKGTVRVRHLDNRFTVTPLPDGWTRITFETFADPGGFIPGWLANLVAERAPRDSLNGMARLMQEPQYQITRASQLPPQFVALRSMTFPAQPVKSQ